MLYGEGLRALLRLQEEIAKDTNDFRLLTWKAVLGGQANPGVFADTPLYFVNPAPFRSSVIIIMHNSESVMSNKGLRMTGNLFPLQNGT